MNDENEWFKMKDIIPKSYICYKNKKVPKIDGDINKDFWKDIPFSDYFIDIEGYKSDIPKFKSRFKSSYDDDFLYVIAQLKEKNISAFLKENNSIIFHDNDFEVFIDPDADNMNYYELEVNALNTIWELSLPKPYKDGGEPINPNNLSGLKSAVKINGALNNPSLESKEWFVEIAFPFEDLKQFHFALKKTPDDKDIWRINFSRVEWDYEIIDDKYQKLEGRPEYNWVFSPQGIIDMHRPEKWAFLQFSENKDLDTSFELPADFLARQIAMDLYYIQKTNFKLNGRYLSKNEIRLNEVENKNNFFESIEFYGQDAFLARIRCFDRILSIDNTSKLRFLL